MVRRSLSSACSGCSAAEGCFRGSAPVPFPAVALGHVLAPQDLPVDVAPQAPPAQRRARDEYGARAREGVQRIAALAHAGRVRHDQRELRVQRRRAQIQALLEVQLGHELARPGRGHDAAGVAPCGRGALRRPRFVINLHDPVADVRAPEAHAPAAPARPGIDSAGLLRAQIQADAVRLDAQAPRRLLAEKNVGAFQRRRLRRAGAVVRPDAPDLERVPDEDGARHDVPQQPGRRRAQHDVGLLARRRRRARSVVARRRVEARAPEQRVELEVAEAVRVRLEHEAQQVAVGDGVVAGRRARRLALLLLGAVDHFVGVRSFLCCCAALGVCALVLMLLRAARRSTDVAEVQQCRVAPGCYTCSVAPVVQGRGVHGLRVKCSRTLPP